MFHSESHSSPNLVQPKTFKAVGIDVAKEHLDVAISRIKNVRTFGNTSTGHEKIATLLINMM